MIYAMGNSHVCTFTNSEFSSSDEFFKSSDYPFTSWIPNLSRIHSKKYLHVTSHKFMERSFPHIHPIINSYEIDKKVDWIMLVVGEIDCRCLLPKKIREKNLPFYSTINEDVNEFFQAFLKLKEEGYKLIGWGIHPCRSKHTIGVINIENEIKTYGNHLFRNSIVIFWNNCLQLLCKSHDIPFISIFDDLVNLDGTIKTEYYHDDFHLNQLIMPIIIERLKEEGIL